MLKKTTTKKTEEALNINVLDILSYGVHLKNTVYK